MAKLNQLILLENMMKTYDAMNIKDANLTHFQGVCTEKLVDEINGRLERLVVFTVLGYYTGKYHLNDDLVFLWLVAGMPILIMTVIWGIDELCGWINGK